MSQSIDLSFSGLSNTKHRALVGELCYDCQNISLDNGVLESDSGYSLQIPELGQTAWGIGFGRFEGTEEFLAVIGSGVYTATPTSSAWTLIANGVAQSPWQFLQYGNTIYGVNSSIGLIAHTIGTSSWVGSEKPAIPTNPLYSTERIYRSSASYPQRSIKEYFGGTWTSSGDLTDFPGLAKSGSGDYFITFRFNSGSDAPNKDYNFRHILTLPNLNWAYNDFLELEVKLTPSSSATAKLNNNRINVSIEGTSAIIQPMVGTEITTNERTKKRRFYFKGDRTARASVSKLIIDWSAFTGFDAWNGASTFTYTIVLGDTWQNNDDGFVVDDGPIVAARKYAYSVLDVSTGSESDLSTATASIATPAGGPIVGALGGSFTRIGLHPATGGVLTSSDTLKLYRQRLLDNAWVYVGSIGNSGTPYISDTSTGTCFVDDKYMEWELDSLTEFDNLSNLPPELDPQVIGRFRGSLALGIGKDLYISKVAKPAQYEDINAAPSLIDQGQGRSVYVDETRAEDLNMILGSNALYLGTKNRTYFMFGDFPKDLSAPRAIDNIGPIGTRASTEYRGGIAILNAEGLWFIKYSELTNTNVGDLLSQEISSDIKQSIQTLAPTASSVLTVHRGELYAFQGNKYLRLSRKGNQFTQGTLNHQIVAAIPDYTNELRLLTKNGGLAKIAGSTYSGSAINWSWSTGNIITPRARINSIQLICSGNPSLTITSEDGKYGSNSKTYSIDDEVYSIPLSSSKSYGTQFSLSFNGTQNDKVIAVKLGFEHLGGGLDR